MFILEDDKNQGVMNLFFLLIVEWIEHEYRVGKSTIDDNDTYK